jgi:glycosyltransferase involved in cell wall biosynthesis
MIAANTQGTTRRVLLITPLDPSVHVGSTEEHRARAWAASGAQVTVISKRLHRSRRLLDILRQSLSTSSQRHLEGGILWIAVDPFFNGHPGLRTEVEERADPGRVQLFLLRCLSPLGLLRELAFMASALWTGLRAGRFDVCIAAGPWSALVGRLLRRLGRVRALLVLDRDLEAATVRDGVRRWVTERLENSAIRHADLTISTAQRLQSHRSAAGLVSRYLPNGVHAAPFQLERSAGDASQRMLYVGNLIAWSGLLLTIDALAEVRRTLPEAELWIAGAGLPGFTQALQQRVTERNLQHAVRFLGAVPAADLPALAANCALGLCNSQPIELRRHALPLKLLEYFAAGLAVLATQDTEAGDLVESLEAGLTVPHELAPTVAALTALLGDRAQRLRCGAAARQAARGFDWTALIAVERQAVEAVLQHQPPPAGGGR